MVGAAGPGRHGGGIIDYSDRVTRIVGQNQGDFQPAGEQRIDRSQVVGQFGTILRTKEFQNADILVALRLREFDKALRTVEQGPFQVGSAHRGGGDNAKGYQNQRDADHDGLQFSAGFDVDRFLDHGSGVSGQVGATGLGRELVELVDHAVGYAIATEQLDGRQRFEAGQ